MPFRLPRHSRPPAGSALLPRFAWSVLVYNVAVVLWGAVVRATSSGAGCGDHWPLCNGVVVQTHPRLATLIELAHRMTSGITVIAILLLLVWIFRSTVAGHLARITVVAATVLIFNEALLGALLVLLRLTADNRSPARAVYLSLHLANTLLLLAALALSAHFLSRREAFDRRTVRFAHLPQVMTGLVAILAVGMTGTLAALSDTLFPASSVRRRPGAGLLERQQLAAAAALSSPAHGGDCRPLHLLAAAAQRPAPRGTQTGDRSVVAAGPAVWPRRCGRGAARSPVAADYASAGSGPSMDRIGCAGRQGLRSRSPERQATKVAGLKPCTA